MAFVASKKRQELIKTTMVYITLSIGAVIILLPIAWMLSTALKESGSIFLFPPQWI
ncbi:MAG TPA: sugar ABC transporter permease, partial [Firmicutes bacterium]|nr:sugar ABC transporter permease [Bacillota bacterium]